MHFSARPSTFCANLGWFNEIIDSIIDGLRKAGDAPGHKIVVAVCVCVFVVVVVVVGGGSC